jgi:hypothetical protein
MLARLRQREKSELEPRIKKSEKRKEKRKKRKKPWERELTLGLGGY